MTTERIQDYLYSWNPADPLLARVRLEDDIRDGLQGAYVRKPTLTERKELLELSAAVGTQAVLIGFPAISTQEFDDCYALLAHAQEKKLPLHFSFLARTLVSDVEPIVALARAFPEIKVRADSFIGTSLVRRKVENWEFSELLQRIKTVGNYLLQEKTPFGLSIEDATRTPPDDMIQTIDRALEVEIKNLTLCDTVGDSTPEGAARITEFVLEYLTKQGVQLELMWHGHNDKGLGVANAIAAARAGADIISGTFLGIGERTGNTALEQVALLLAQAGNTHHHLAAIKPYCDKLSEYTQVPIAQTAPIIGQQAFTTAAGTHSAAVLKAKALGLAFEDYVFSAVPASDLGRSQELLIAPVSGSANVRYMLEQFDVTPTTALIEGLLAHAKTKDKWLTRQDIRDYLNTQPF
ncbi:hypothetical protein [Thioflexithrix psekupsensis]|uniref:Homocitrate synthase n=1 Tax=Thioflexithrix psekupsensis TaxID=1570016 RepID=A0A251X808_9GAMM|nr:hypothetical protein [Thioflexithrix psekupsensis]OUD13813.1 hypothetical protein TPSD3_05545 [Thioflexithrix psekupsensis]